MMPIAISGFSAMISWKSSREIFSRLVSERAVTVADRDRDVGGSRKIHPAGAEVGAEGGDLLVRGIDEREADRPAGQAESP